MDLTGSRGSQGSWVVLRSAVSTTLPPITYHLPPLSCYTRHNKRAEQEQQRAAAIAQQQQAEIERLRGLLRDRGIVDVDPGLGSEPT